MKPAEVLERLLPRWRARISARHAPADVDGFVRRHGVALETLVAQVLRARGGEPPDTAEDFAAYDPIVARERRRDASTDKAVLEQLMRQVDADLRRGYREQLILTNYGLEYVETRAEAIVLRAYGWDAVPLLLVRPALAVVAAGMTVESPEENDVLAAVAGVPIKDLRRRRAEVARLKAGRDLLAKAAAYFASPPT